MKNILLLIFILGSIFLLYSCLGKTNKDQEIPSLGKSDQIIQKAIAYMNGSLLEKAKISFEFRGQKIMYLNNHGEFLYTRNFRDTSDNQILDSLSNHGFDRFINGEKQELSELEKTGISGGINSIIYFAFLPNQLTDPAVNTEYIDEVKIKDKSYHKIKVWFDEEGGGEDHDDEFLYYFDSEDYSLDYLAYSYHVHGGGIRLRAGYNERDEHGLVIRDYINYKAEPDSIDFNQIEEYYEKGLLEELSKIELENFKLHSPKE